MFIDIHAHVQRYPERVIQRFPTADELVALYDKLGIEKGVILPVVSPEIYLPQTNEDILDAAEKYPDRLIPYCNVDPRAFANSPFYPLDEVLQYYKDRGCKVIGEVMPNMELMDPLVQNLFRCAEKVDLPIVFDGSGSKTESFGLYDDPGLPQLECTLQRFPNLKIFGHGPVFWSEIARLETPGERAVMFKFGAKGQMGGNFPKGRIKEEGVVPKLFRKFENLHGDLSDPTAYNAFARDDEYGPQFMEEFCDRLYFGTDICGPGVPQYIVDMINLLTDWRDSKKISEKTFNKIAKENAIKLFGI